MILCVPTGERYIGASKRLALRRNSHFSALRCGGHPCGRLRALAAKYGVGNFRWAVLEEVPDGPDMDARLRSAEHQHLAEACAHNRDLLISRPNLIYIGRSGKSLASIMGEFRKWCQGRGLSTRDELERALATHMDLTGSARSPRRR